MDQQPAGGGKALLQKSLFFTPEQSAQEQRRRTESVRGRLLIVSCRSGTELAVKVASEYNRLLKSVGSGEQIPTLYNVDRNFSDTETVVRLNGHVSGYDVFLFQSLLDPRSGRPIDQNYMAFLIAARAFRENGASHITAVLPYLAYARQDKPTKFMREPTTAKLMADLALAAGIDRLVVWSPHCGQLRGFYGSIPVHMLDPLTLFLDEFERFRGAKDVLAVAPDEGAAKFVTQFGDALGLECAIASKYRPRPEESFVRQIIGDFQGKTKAIVIDDMISGGGTMSDLVKKLSEEKGIMEVHVGISHNLCLPAALERLEELRQGHNLKSLVITDSIPQSAAFQALPYMKVRSLDEILARTINRIHYDKSVSEMFFRPETNGEA